MSNQDNQSGGGGGGIGPKQNGGITQSSVWSVPEQDIWACMVKEMNEQKVKSHRRIEYDVPSVGHVLEEVTINMYSTNNAKQQDDALHSVYVNGTLARQVNLKNKQVIKSDPRYEPYAFLRGLEKPGSLEAIVAPDLSQVPIEYLNFDGTSAGTRNSGKK